MKYGVYVIFDRSTGKYSLPFFSVNVETAIRSFKCSLQGLPELVVKDTILFVIADFDDTDCDFVSRETKESVYSGVDYLDCLKEGE